MFVLVEFLVGVWPWLGVTLALACVYIRYSYSNLWFIFGPGRDSLPIPVAAIYFLSLGVPVGALFLGLFPAWSVGEWAIVLMYVTVFVAAVTSPIDTVGNTIEDQLDIIWRIDVLVESMADRRAELKAAAPADVTVNLAVPDAPTSIVGAQQFLLENDVDEFDAWVDVYERYFEAYDRLESELGDRIAILSAGDSAESLETVVAGFAQNMQPKYYDDVEDAADAVSVFETLVDAYETDTVDGEALLSEDTETLLSILAPASDALALIESCFRSVPEPASPLPDGR